MIDGDLGQVCSTRGQVMTMISLVFCAVGYVAVLALQIGW